MPSANTISAYSGKTVFLTGATGGLGRALALELAQCQVGHLLLSARKLNALEEVAQECQQLSSSSSTLKIDLLVCDLSDPASVAATAEKALTVVPQIDVLMHNGGVSSRSRFVDTALDVDAQVMQINFLAGAALAKAFVPGMIASKNNGKIIWISSLQGLLGIPNRSSYAASKFAVQGYTESIRAELYSSGVTVHTVSPGYIRTNLSNAAMVGDGTNYGKTDPTTAAGADPADVARQVLARIARGEMDFTIASTLSSMVAMVLRFFFPGLLRWLLVKRYEKSVKDKQD